MQLFKNEIEKLEKIFKLNLINSITGIKPANLIGTQSKNGLSNLAIFSSVVHLGSSPALIGFIMRPKTEVRRDTYENLIETGYYTINHVVTDLTQNAHFTSVKFEKEETEFEYCGFTPEYIKGFEAPFVKESKIKMGLKFVEELNLKNGTSLIIGEIEVISIADHLISDLGYLDLEMANSTGISGLNTYYKLQKMSTLPYARRTDLPIYTNEKK
jgi:flavin reductase (DIM6/NTAB) family NADH-FMN oxidoreductase RutF